MVPPSPVQRRVRELVRFTQQLQRVHPNVLAKALSRGIVHQDKNLVVINKPYGLPVHAGVVDIPIIEKEVQGQQQHHKMTLSPSYRMDNGKMVRVRPSRNAHLAVTQYRVLSSTLSSALLELQPITGIKHQLRVHLSFGLDCPVLGDHKYSDWNRLAPQKLPVGILKKLGLPQSKARHVPLHLHARQLTLPALQSGKEELSLVCKPPLYFRTLHIDSWLQWDSLYRLAEAVDLLWLRWRKGRGNWLPAVLAAVHRASPRKALFALGPSLGVGSCDEPHLCPVGGEGVQIGGAPASSPCFPSSPTPDPLLCCPRALLSLLGTSLKPDVASSSSSFFP
ncbi:RNA pseudouridylate synthase domain-containing protein 4 [Camelus ferus]|nr:RNA pseudouridylate synthase domain-containing protein 4 [Camelus ferus]